MNFPADGNGNTLSYLGTIGSSSGDAGDQYTGLDRFGRVINQKWQNSSGTVVDEQLYGYDADSNVSYQDNTVSAMNPYSESFTYDGLNRLTDMSTGAMSTTSPGTFTGSTTEKGWNLNAVGGWNSTSTTVGGTTTTVTRDNNAQNQVKNISSGSTTLGYDKNGNTLTDDNDHTYTYDAWNRLISVTVGTDTITYTYDALGRRITEGDSTAGTSTDLYYSNRGQVIEEDTATSSYSFTNTCIWSAFYVNQMVAENEGPAVFTDLGGGTDSFGGGGGGISLSTWIFAQQDADYNVTSLANSSGTIIERYSYDPYGLQTVYNASGSALSGSAYQWIYGFQGGRYNPTTGLVHFVTRDEEVNTGSWAAEDLAGYVNGLNRYQLEEGNSVVSADPSGFALILIGFVYQATQVGADGMSSTTYTGSAFQLNNRLTSAHAHWDFINDESTTLKARGIFADEPECPSDFTRMKLVAEQGTINEASADDLLSILNSKTELTDFKISLYGEQFSVQTGEEILIKSAGNVASERGLLQELDSYVGMEKDELNLLEFDRTALCDDSSEFLMEDIARTSAFAERTALFTETGDAVAGVAAGGEVLAEEGVIEELIFEGLVGLAL